MGKVRGKKVRGNQRDPEKDIVHILQAGASPFNQCRINVIS